MFEGYEWAIHSLAAPAFTVAAFTVVIVPVTAHVQGKDGKSA